MYSYLYHSYTYKIKTLSKLFIDDIKFNQGVSKSRHGNKVKIKANEKSIKLMRRTEYFWRRTSCLNRRKEWIEKQIFHFAVMEENICYKLRKKYTVVCALANCFEAKAPEEFLSEFFLCVSTSKKYFISLRLGHSKIVRIRTIKWFKKFVKSASFWIWRM